MSGAFMSLFGQVQSCSPLFPYFLSHLLSPGFRFGFTVSVTPRRQGSTITTRSSWLVGEDSVLQVKQADPLS